MKFISVYEARRQRLNKARDRFKTIKEMADKLKVDSSSMSKYINGSKKIGDDKAREFEKALGLREFEMDQQLIVEDLQEAIRKMASTVGIESLNV